MKVTSKRGKIEITHDILQLCTAPSRRTHIMYKCNMSFEQLEFYLTPLLAKGYLVAKTAEGPTDSRPSMYYLTTDAGRALLSQLAGAATAIKEAFAQCDASQLRGNCS